MLVDRWQTNLNPKSVTESETGTVIAFKVVQNPAEELSRIATRLLLVVVDYDLAELL